MNKVVLTLLLMSGLAGCVTTQQDRAAIGGGAVGATAGAVIGSDSGNAVKGGMIGGILGAAAGVLLQQNQRQAAPQRRTNPSRQYVEHRSNQRHDRHDDHEDD